MAEVINGISHPELVVGIAGPIGIDIETLTEVITDAFDGVGYKTIPIRITDEIKDITSPIRPPSKQDYNSVIRYKMRHASAICRKFKDQAYLMRI